VNHVALACDYDGTVAHDGRVEPATLAALRRVRESGRRLVLVTGRLLDDLARACPCLDVFHAVVAENGAVLFDPASGDRRVLGEPPPTAFVEVLRRQGVEPLEIGLVVVATRQPHEHAVLETIRSLGLELQVVFNKGAVMVLPPGVNKATGLVVALDRLGISLDATVGVGDAENDHAMLAAVGYGVAVANALASIKERAALVTVAPDGAGVAELCERLLAEDLPGVRGAGGSSTSHSPTPYRSSTPPSGRRRG
jgi:hydroxymethylpyrimidine pyrophosphatase-like HAD family hydrolase